jgi:hypothetical protein
VVFRVEGEPFGVAADRGGDGPSDGWACGAALAVVTDEEHRQECLCYPPQFFVSVASKRLSIPVSSLESALTSCLQVLILKGLRLPQEWIYPRIREVKLRLNEAAVSGRDRGLAEKSLQAEACATKQKRQQGCWRYTVGPTILQPPAYCNSKYLSSTNWHAVTPETKLLKRWGLPGLLAWTSAPQSKSGRLRRHHC